jgi:uncharacterized protein (TIGR01244 family)
LSTSSAFPAPQLSALAEGVFATAQLQPEAMAWAADVGFKSIINNRPDDEGGPEQPSAQAIGDAADAVGLKYAYLPVSPAIQTPEQIQAFASLLETLPKPILAFCRSGARTTKLFMAATQES